MVTAVARASRNIAMSGTMPEPPPRSSAGVVAVPHEVAADRAADLELVAHLEDVVQEGRDLTVVEPLDRELDLVAAVGR